jgi:hypothetical protein
MMSIGAIVTFLLPVIIIINPRRARSGALTQKADCHEKTKKVENRSASPTSTKRLASLFGL